MTELWSHRFDGLLNALTFYTRLPIPDWGQYHERGLSRTNAFLPIVGIFVGLSTALVYKSSSIFLPLEISILLSMVASILLTGALHEDGFADTCDGFGAGWTPEQTLKIMKDSHLGTYGILGLILILGLKFFSLKQFNAEHCFGIIIIGHTISRLVALWVLQLSDYVQELGSKSKAFTSKLSFKAISLSTVISFLPILYFFPSQIWPTLILCFTLCLFFKIAFYKKIKGVTGDTLGASQQVSEVMIYLYLCSQFI